MRWRDQSWNDIIQPTFRFRFCHVLCLTWQCLAGQGNVRGSSWSSCCDLTQSNSGCPLASQHTLVLEMKKSIKVTTSCTSYYTHYTYSQAVHFLNIEISLLWNYLLSKICQQSRRLKVISVSTGAILHQRFFDYSYVTVTSLNLQNSHRCLWKNTEIAIEAVEIFSDHRVALGAYTNNRVPGSLIV